MHHQQLLTNECRDTCIIKLVSVLITLQGISDTTLQQQLVSQLRQVSRVPVLQAGCLLLQVIRLLQN